jgi:hypothetical protein
MRTGHHYLISIVIFFAVAIATVPLTSCCYVFPADVRNPCADKHCSFGAQCAVSLDGLTARCQCPDTCVSYGDSDDSGPVCASDGKDYDSSCDMRKASCHSMRELHVKYRGKCGEYNAVFYLSYSLLIIVITRANFIRK